MTHGKDLVKDKLKLLKLAPSLRKKIVDSGRSGSMGSMKVGKFPHYISSSELMAASVCPGTEKNYRGAGRRFYSYLDNVYKLDPSFPKLNIILKEYNLFQLDVLLREFLTFKFNVKKNRGSTLSNEVSGILYCIAVDFGISLSASLLPSVRRICKGADNILDQWYGKQPKGKFPLLNPILEDMLRYATADERWALLLAQRFSLRSQHYCNNSRMAVPNDMSDNEDVSQVSYLRVRDLRFFPSIHNPTSITIISRFDKNHPDLTHMERTVYCSCNTRWTCIVHEAQQRFSNNKWSLDAALAQCRDGDMHYSAMRCIVRSLIGKIGLNPSNYGTHGARSGGTSEMFIEGRGATFIKAFNWWKNLGSVFAYIKPNNPDLLKYYPSFSQYRDSRLRESGLADKVDAQWDEMFIEWNNQRRKIVTARNRARVLAQAARCGGPVRGPLNSSTVQNRLPLGNPTNLMSPAAQLNSRGVKMHHRPMNFSEYTNYTSSHKRVNIKRNKPKFVKTTVGWRTNPYK